MSVSKNLKNSVPVLDFATRQLNLRKPKLRLGAQSVTLLSTLRDPTQLRRRQCATKKGKDLTMVHYYVHSSRVVLRVTRDH